MASKARQVPSFRNNLKEYFAEYTKNTGMHGIKYMGERDRSIVEKLWWFISFSISVSICLVLIQQMWRKWETSPVLVSFAKSPTPIWQVPFPAVTICSEIKGKQHLFNYTQIYDKFIQEPFNMTEEETRKIEKSALICDNRLYMEGPEFTDFSSVEFMISIAPQFEDIFFECQWTSKNNSCHKFFTPMLTEDGLCFTFNMLDRSELIKNNVFFHGDYMSHGIKAKDWSLDLGYNKTAKIDSYPRRALSSGSRAGLSLILRANDQDLDYICRGPVQGFKILLHNPAEVPQVGIHYFRLPFNHEAVVSIKPDMMTTSEALRNYDPKRRQCYFPSEKQLAFYQSYTQANCQIECLTNFTRDSCGCVAYYMPHEESTPICGSGSLPCLHGARQELLKLEVEAGLSTLFLKDSNYSECDCLPSCVSLSYNTEISQAEFNWPKLFEVSHKKVNTTPGVQLSRVTLFFKQQQFITSERNELYGQRDFLANCGGLLGLFTGFSFLSIIEIIYYLTVRLIFNISMYGRHFWSASKILLNDETYSKNK